MKKIEAFTKMNDEFIEKYFPDRSVFSKYKKANKANSNVLLFMFYPLLALSVLLLCTSIFKTCVDIKNNITEDSEIGLIMIAFSLVMCALFVFGIYKGHKRKRKRTEDILSKVAKKNGYSELEIREFDAQTFSSTTMILSPDGMLDNLTAGYKPGFLTQNWIMLSDVGRLCKRNDLHTICMVERTEMLQDYKQRTFLSVSILSKQGTIDFRAGNQDFCKELMNLVINQNPDVFTNNFTVMKEKEFNCYVKNYKSEHAL